MPPRSRGNLTHVQMSAGRLVAHPQLEVVGLRRVGEQAALQRLGDGRLLAVEPGVVQRERAAAGDLDGQGDLRVGARRPVPVLSIATAPNVSPRARSGTTVQEVVSSRRQAVRTASVGNEGATTSWCTIGTRTGCPVSSAS